MRFLVLGVMCGLLLCSAQQSEATRFPGTEHHTTESRSLVCNGVSYTLTISRRVGAVDVESYITDAVVTRMVVGGEVDSEWRSVDLSGVVPSTMPNYHLLPSSTYCDEVNVGFYIVDETVAPMRTGIVWLNQRGANFTGGEELSYDDTEFLNCLSTTRSAVNCVSKDPD